MTKYFVCVMKTQSFPPLPPKSNKRKKYLFTYKNSSFIYLFQLKAVSTKSFHTKILRTEQRSLTILDSRLFYAYCAVSIGC